MKALRVSDGAIEALKWIDLVVMTRDHVNKYLFNATLPGLFEAGRLCLPLFVFVLAYNLARPGTLASGAYLRTLKRLAIFGALASAPFMALGGLLAGWWRNGWSCAATPCAGSSAGLTRADRITCWARWRLRTARDRR